MKKRIRTFWTRARPLLPVLAGWLGLYLDDLLMVSGGVCFVSAAALRWGAAAGLATAGGCLVLFSVLVARAGRR